MVILCVSCVLFVCAVDKFGVDRYFYRGECVEVCPQAHFHTVLKACEPCPSHCKLCSSATHCIRCEDSFYINDGVCNKLECGEGLTLCSCAVQVSLVVLLIFSTVSVINDVGLWNYFALPGQTSMYVNNLCVRVCVRGGRRPRI